jgi:hypothetical protein
MGSVPKPETERNLALINDYLELKPDGGFKYTIAQLGLKYARTDEQGGVMPLTSTRIHQILKKYSIDKNRVIRRNNNN